MLDIDTRLCALAHKRRASDESGRRISLIGQSQIHIFQGATMQNLLRSKGCRL